MTKNKTLETIERYFDKLELNKVESLNVNGEHLLIIKKRFVVSQDLNYGLVYVNYYQDGFKEGIDADQSLVFDPKKHSFSDQIIKFIWKHI